MIELVNDRALGLEAMRGAIAERLPVDASTLASSLTGWEVLALRNGAETAGAVMFKGNEVHIGILPEHRKRWYSRSLKKAVLGPLIDAYGWAKTSVMKTNERGIRFVEALGFRRTEENESVIHYRLDTL